MIRLFAPLLLLLTAQTAPDTMTLAQARALSPEALARQLLGASAALVREAKVQALLSQWADRNQLERIVFAGRPLSADWPGLCLVDRITVWFRPVRRDVPGNDDVSATISDLTRDTLYRLVDAGPVPAHWSDVYGKALQTACDRIGPVLAQDPEVRAHFFESAFLEGPVPGKAAPGLAALFQARILADLVRDLRAGVGPSVTCKTLPLENRNEPCAQQVIGTATQPAIAIRTQPCEDEPAHWCVEARHYESWLQWTTLTVETDHTNDLFGSVPIYRATLEYHHAVE